MMAAGDRRAPWKWLSRSVGAVLCLAGDTSALWCGHEYDGIQPPENQTWQSENHTLLKDGASITESIGLNMSRLYYYENLNVSTMNQPDRFRKLLISLEPCEGIVYLLVRKTRRCWPNAHSCCKPLPGATLQGMPLTEPSPPPCSRGVHSVKAPLTSAKYFITIYAPSEVNQQLGILTPKYRLTVLADIGAYPRPGRQGQVTAKQLDESSVELQWDQANFIPAGVSGLKNYHVYSSLLLPGETKQSDSVVISPAKVMNTVCGLERNAVRYRLPLTDANCKDGVCTTVVSGIVPRRRYIFNIIAESWRAHTASYAGIVVRTDWAEADHLLSDSVIQLVGAICGTVFGVVVIGHLWLMKLYS
eukprot:TRINITY_DN38355_c0_g1_i1.p1 TRINITY_DN38355_c0_g1~~TRINITY_DN38355_c0_g1_i1.p1  ORF type:complete len:360 (-),score=50.20 TRINITY_DN38355_c0_g1_i1:294-1373(-)